MLNRQALAAAADKNDEELNSLDSALVSLGIDSLAAAYEAERQALKMAMHYDGFPIEQIRTHSGPMILSAQALELIPLFAAMFIAGMTTHARAISDPQIGT